MPRHKKGTLVRLRTKKEMGDRWDFLNTDEADPDNNGVLWVVQRFLPAKHGDNMFQQDAYECRSLSTGTTMQLFPGEITTRSSRDGIRTGHPNQG